MSPAHVHVPPSLAALQPYVDAGVLSPVDVHLAGWVQRAGAVDDPLVLLAAAAAAWATRHGHVCADLDQLPRAVARSITTADTDTGTGTDVPDWPTADVWVDALRAAPHVVRVVDRPDAVDMLDPRPLVLHRRRLYLQRHWLDECAVAASLRARAASTGASASGSSLALLDALLPSQVDGEVDLQRTAADTVAAHPFAVVVGGPGTGKTYSVARLLAALVQQALDEGRQLRIALAAPTGKAAARLHESIRAAVEQPDVQTHLSAEVRTVLESLAPTTIHRLLGSQYERRQRFRHDRTSPLPHDVVVVDETSMVSLPLLARLVEAVRPEARFVLIGDPDQLESVELGAVLGDIAAGAVTGPLAGRVVRLLRGHRFGGDLPIARFADAVRAGDTDTAVALLAATRAADPAAGGLCSVDLGGAGDPMAPAPLAAVQAVVQPVLRAVRSAALAGDAAGALASASTIRILCAHRRGRFGVAEWNRLAERWMAEPAAAALGGWYAGRLLLATRNDPRLGLSNGDTGVVVQRGDHLVAAFAVASGVAEFEPAQLEAVETAFAITVHKSQGSEYDGVVMVLPPATSPLAGRELVYTGATRAKHLLVVVGDDDAVRSAVGTPATRMTGLAEALSLPAADSH